MPTPDDDSNAEQRIVWRVLDVLSRGRKTESYKFAVLVALIDLVMEGVDDGGRPPTQVSGEHLLDRVTELYWRETLPIDADGHARQGSGRGSVVDKAAVREERLRAAGWTGGAPTPASRRTSARPWSRRPGAQSSATPSRCSTSSTATRSRSSTTSGRTSRPASPTTAGRRLPSYPAQGNALMRFGPLLREVTLNAWLEFVRAKNDDRVDPDLLADRLFGVSRTRLGVQRKALESAGASGCLYFGATPRAVDHFLPFSRTGEDGLANLVLGLPSVQLPEIRSTRVVVAPRSLARAAEGRGALRCSCRVRARLRRRPRCGIRPRALPACGRGGCSALARRRGRLRG